MLSVSMTSLNSRALGRYAIRLAILLVVVRMPHPTRGTLTFHKPTDVLGMASTFEGGLGLPERNCKAVLTVYFPGMLLFKFAEVMKPPKAAPPNDATPKDATHISTSAW